MHKGTASYFTGKAGAGGRKYVWSYLRDLNPPRARTGRRMSASDPLSTLRHPVTHLLGPTSYAVSQLTFSTSLPTFSPANRRASASGKLSKPSTTSSRAINLPSANQPAISR